MDFTRIRLSDDTRWVNHPDVVDSVPPGIEFSFDAERVDDVERTDVITDVGSLIIRTSVRLDRPKIFVKDSNDVEWQLDKFKREYVQHNDRTFEIEDPTLYASIRVSGQIPKYRVIEPIAVRNNDTIVARTKTWDPLNNVLHQPMVKEIEYITTFDPADYIGSVWADRFLGSKWLDLTTVGYVPYDDTTTFPSMADRHVRWGRQSTWSNPVVYEWIKSSTHPKVYEDRIRNEEANTDIIPDLRASGIPFHKLRHRTTSQVVDLTPIDVIWPTQAFVDSIKADPNRAGLDVIIYRDGYVHKNTTVSELTTDDIATGKHYVTVTFQIPKGSDDYERVYQYHVMYTTADGFVEEPVYYFWVANRKVSRNQEPPSAVLASWVHNPPAPYHIFTHYAIEPFSDPERGFYASVVLRNIAHLVTSDECTLELINDPTLRDELDLGRTYLDLKNQHTEWIIARQKQPFKVPRALWDKLSEALIGYTLASWMEPNTTPIPTPNPLRVLYDQKYGTSTRIGLGEGQAFVDREQGLVTIQYLIRRPEFDPKPLDKHDFLKRFKFDTPENIAKSMAYIFESLSDETTNYIFFEMLHDALSNSQEYVGIFKTSFVALQGIRVLEAPRISTWQ